MPGGPLKVSDTAHASHRSSVRSPHKFTLVESSGGGQLHSVNKDLAARVLGAIANPKPVSDPHHLPHSARVPIGPGCLPGEVTQPLVHEESESLSTRLCQIS